jgi:hypothetical protein
MIRGVTADDQAEQNGEECRALDQRIAGGQFTCREMVGQDAVFDRAKEGGDDAEPEQRGIEEGQGAEPETRGGDHLHEDFRELQPAGNDRLVMRVGDFAAERRNQQ